MIFSLTVLPPERATGGRLVVPGQSSCPTPVRPRPGRLRAHARSPPLVPASGACHRVARVERQRERVHSAEAPRPLRAAAPSARGRAAAPWPQISCPAPPPATQTLATSTEACC